MILLPQAAALQIFLPSTYMEQVVLCNGEEPTVERIIYQCL